MKQKFKNTKGITLVALIITIIVLLILAVVAITSISKSNIIKHAQNGKEAYEQGKTNEATTLAEYEQYLDDNSNKKVEWGCYKDDDGTTILLYIGNNDTVTIKSTDKILAYIGDFDENENFVPTTTIETIDIASLKGSSESDIGFSDNTVIKELYIDKEFGNLGDEGVTININIPDGLETIHFLEGKEVLNHFEGSELLTKIYLPSTINKLTEYCFKNCNKSNTVIYYNGTQEQWNAIDKQMTYASGLTVKCTDGDITI